MIPRIGKAITRIVFSSGAGVNAGELGSNGAFEDVGCGEEVLIVIVLNEVPGDLSLVLDGGMPFGPVDTADWTHEHYFIS